MAGNVVVRNVNPAESVDGDGASTTDVAGVVDYLDEPLTIATIAVLPCMLEVAIAVVDVADVGQHPFEGD